MKKIIIGVIFLTVSITAYMYIISSKALLPYSGFLYIAMGFSGFYTILGISEFTDMNKSYIISHSNSYKNSIIINRKRLLEISVIAAAERDRSILSIKNISNKISELYNLKNDILLELDIENSLIDINIKNKNEKFKYLNGKLAINDVDINLIINDYIFEKELLYGKEIKLSGKVITDQLLSYASILFINNIETKLNFIRCFIFNEEERYSTIKQMCVLSKESAAMFFLYLNNYLVIENATAY